MRSEPAVAALLSRTELFGQLGPADQALVAHEMRSASFQAGQAIFSRGDPGDEVYLVVEGRVRLSVVTADGRTVSYRHACSGSIFGEIAALDGGVRTADATALTSVVAKTLSQRSLDALIRSNPRFARAAIEYLCTRLRDTSEQVESIALHPLETRVARFLLSAIALNSNEPSHAKVTLNFRISQSELAFLIGGSRQKVNAALARLEAMGAIDRQSGNLVCDVPQLARIADRGEA
jgi:CRP/FNR family transcriptional regulator, cyclic AMP receptor protein